MRTEGTFGVEQTTEPDGAVRLKLRGELDHSASEVLASAIARQKAARDPAILDLSELEFIDSSGVRVIVVAVRDARQDSWPLEVEKRLSWQVQRVFDVLGLGAVLWPEASGDG